MSPTDFSVSNPTLAVVSFGLVGLCIASVMVAKALRRHKPHRFQPANDGDHARANAVMRTEAEIENIRGEIAYWTKQRKRKVPQHLHAQLHNAKIRLAALTGEA